MKNFLFVILLNLILLLNVFSGNKKYIIPSNNIDKWYSTGVFYEMFVRSFYDSDGDKYGDFRGVIQKIDYLEKLGISGIWFMPIHPAADRLYGHGYDVKDHFSVNSDYGTLDDFKELLNLCHSKNIKIIIDFVVNHVSVEHPFFVDALNNPDSKYKEWFVFSDTKPDKKSKGHWIGVPKDNPTKWYYAYFGEKMPDLNYKNPEVLEYMKSVLKFWLSIGVDGFRFDAVTLIYEKDPQNVENQPESLDILKEFRKFVDENSGGKESYLVAEAGTKQIDYLGNGKDMFHSVFNFKFNNTLIRTVKNLSPFTTDKVNMVESIVAQYVKDLSGKEGCWWATVLSNHDEYVGKRPFRQLEADIEKTKLLGSIFLSLPGIPFVYYGEEIAMDANPSFKGDRFLRSVMQWDDSKNAGFTSATKPWNVVNDNYPDYNVQKFENDENSILNLYRNLINIRKNNRALSLGSFQSMDFVGKNQSHIAYLREHNENRVVVVHSFNNKKSNIKISTVGTSLENFSGDFELLLGKGIKFDYKKNILTITGFNGLSSLIFRAN